MSQPSASQTVTVLNEAGLHLRPAGLLVKTVEKFDCEILLDCNGQSVEANSILSIATLGAGKGVEITIRATGVDAQAAVDELSQLFAEKFFEEAEQTTPHSSE